jgi:hypothetical protein
MERQRKSEKRGSDPFLPHAIIPFLDCPSIQTLLLWTISMILDYGCTKGGIPTIQDGNLEPLYRCFMAIFLTYTEWRLTKQIEEIAQ